MPQAAALALFNAGAPLAIVNAVAGVGTAGAVLHAVAGTALVFGAAFTAQRLLQTGIKQPPSDGTVEVQQPIPPRFWTYGRMKTSGPLALLRSGESDGGDIDPNVTGSQIVKITMLGGRQIDAIETFWLNDDELTLSGTPLYFLGYLQDGDNHISATAYLGSDAQTADANLVANLTGWTSNHRLRGIPNVVTCQGVKDPDDFTPVYGGYGHKTVRALIRGVEVYDPRKDSTQSGGSGSHRLNDPSTWEWSDNVTLCTLDYLLHADGYAIPSSRIDFTSFMTAADIDDEDVDLKAGGTEKRYRVAMHVRLDEPRKNVLAKLLQARDGRLVRNASGKIEMRGGKWVAPDVEIDLDAMTTGLDAEFSQGAQSITRVNEFSLKCMSPAHGYGEIDLDPYSKTDDPDWQAGIIRSELLDLTQVPSPSQAQRLAKIAMAKANPQWVGTMRIGMRGINAIREEAIDVVWSELDIDGPFWIDGGMSFLADRTGVSIPVRSADPDAYDWQSTEEADPPPVPEFS